MAWAIAALVFAVGGLAWLVGEGRFGAQPDLVDDRPVPRLPEGDFTAADVAALHFATMPRGYRPEEVRQFFNGVRRALADGTQISSRDVHEAGFDLVAFGLSSQQVDEVLDRLAGQFERAEQARQPSDAAEWNPTPEQQE